MGELFTRDQRLLNAADYRQVFDGNTARASHRHLLLLARGNSLNHHRLGLVIPKKQVRLAVNRNRIKRVSREFFRRLPLPAPGVAMDVVLLARRDIDKLANADLTQLLQQQWTRIERRITAEVTQ